MYCVIGLSDYLYNHQVRSGGGIIHEDDYEWFISPIPQNTVNHFAVGYFMPDGESFVIVDTFNFKSLAEKYAIQMNGGING